ncbi:MAG: hypothetical protein IT343_01930 [Candidatus Melainabacteria bacterium]|nr:hypothetical protein [Candidatus Melainabacteria bacterium]
MRKMLSGYAYFGRGCLTMRILRPLDVRLLLTATLLLFEPEYETTLELREREDLADPCERLLLRLDDEAWLFDPADLLLASAA